MPIYEFACPKCRVIFNFLSKRVNPDRLPKCPRCGSTNMQKMMSRFAMPRGVPEPEPAGESGGEGSDPNQMPEPNWDDPKIARAMQDLERDVEHMDENNPKHMAHMMRKMKDLLPPGSMPKEFDVAVKRIEAGEDPDKIEEDMGGLFNNLMGREHEPGTGLKGGGAFAHDDGLYDY